MKNTLFLVSLVACGPPAYVGTWQSEDSGGTHASYTLKADGTADFDFVLGSSTVTAKGTYKVDKDMLTIDATGKVGDSAEEVKISTTVNFVVSGDKLVLAPYASTDAVGIIGTWSATTSTTVQGTTNSSASSVTFKNDNTGTLSTSINGGKATEIPFAWTKTNETTFELTPTGSPVALSLVLFDAKTLAGKISILTRVK